MSGVSIARARERADWGVEDFDVDAYLARIGQPRRAPSAAALRDLHVAHVRTVPFENLDVLLGHPGIELGVVAAKLVGRRRGGYCFEHATVFAAAAEALGYPVRRLIARVQPQRFGPRTHLVLAVAADGVEHLVDVGFGAGLWEPVPLRDGVRTDQAGWAHRLDRVGARWVLAVAVADGWEPLYEFDDTEQLPIDVELAHHYTSTHPRSPFVSGPIVMRMAPGLRLRLVGGELREQRPGRPERVIEVPPSRLAEVLGSLGVEPSEGEMRRLLDTIGRGPGILAG